MKYAGMLCASIASMMSVIAHAQGASAGFGVTALELREVVSLGWSAKRQVLAVSVFNDHRDRIGVVDDIVILPDMARSYAVIGVGGFLGIGKRDVVIRLNQLTRQVDGTFVLVGATKEALQALPSFER